MVGCLWFVLAFDLRPSMDGKGAAVLAGTYLVCSVPFFFMGATVSLAMRHYARQIARLYFADLIGSAVGCLLFLVLISLFSGPTVALVSALLAIVGSACFAAASASRPSRAWIAALAVAVVATSTLAATTKAFEVKYTKRYKPLHEKLYEKWSPLAQITVFPGVYWRKSDQMLGWGMSKKYKKRVPVEQMWVAQDASAGTPITQFDGDLSKYEFLEYDVTAFPHFVVDPGNVFILGVGGGRDVLTALRFGHPKVHGCDIHPVIIDLVRDRYADFAGHLYERPDVHIEVGDGRAILRNSVERYDLLQISLIDSWAATAAGAFSLAENNLYTVEAFREYLERLSDDGMLAISRYLFKPRNQTLRVVTTARAALESLGIDDVDQHIAVVATRARVSTSTVMIKKTPFTEAEIDKITREAHRLGFRRHYVPGRRNDQVFQDALSEPEPDKFFADYRYDVRPTTDDRPFFFQMIYFSDALDLIGGKKLVGQKQNYFAYLVLLALIVIAAVFTGLFYILPLVFSKKVGTLPRSWGLFFVLLGLGFMFVEIPLLQKGTLYLGHPTWSMAVVLFSMLVFAGLGSWFSGRVGDGALRFLAVCLLAVAGLVTVVTFALEGILPATIGWPWAVRVAVMILSSAVLAFPMGFAFPLGIGAVNRSNASAIPWAWALNGGGSVLGSIVAMSISMAVGYRATLGAGVLAYALAALLIWRLGRTAEPKADPAD